MKGPTLVGQKFKEYTAAAFAQPDLYPAEISVIPRGYSDDPTRVDYSIRVQVGNAAAADTGSAAEVWVYDGRPDSGGTLLAGPLSIGCGSYSPQVFTWDGVIPQVPHILHVIVSAKGASDLNLANNQADFPVTPELPPKFTYFPLITR